VVDVKTVVADLAVMRGENDERIATEVAKQIRQYALFTIYDDVEASVRDGVVTLTGKVTMPFKASDIGDRVARVPWRARGRQQDLDAARLDVRRSTARHNRGPDLSGSSLRLTNG
jgi:osmotically-inducible protein OsmY